MDPTDRLESLLGAVLRKRHGRIAAVAALAGIAETRLRHALDPEHSQWLTADEMLASIAAARELSYPEAPMLMSALIDRAGGPLPADSERNGRIDDELLPALRRTAAVLEQHGGCVRQMTVLHKQHATLELRAVSALIEAALAELEGR